MEKYIIVSLKHSTENEVVFWRADDSGYTTVPWFAGIYSEEKVKANQDYYNNGYDGVAIPINHDALKEAGLQFQVNFKKAQKFGRKKTNPR